jgi:hypothetical protein
VNRFVPLTAALALSGVMLAAILSRGAAVPESRVEHRPVEVAADAPATRRSTPHGTRRSTAR